MTIYVSEFQQDIIFSDVMSKSDVGQIEVGTEFWKEYCETREIVRMMKQQMTAKFEASDTKRNDNVCDTCSLVDMWCECEKPLEVAQ